MAKRVVLRLDGELEQGFQVTLEIGDDGRLAFSDVTGRLPPAPGLADCLAQWQQQYRQLSVPTRIALQQITIRTGPTAHLQACRQLATELQQQLHHWLESPSFHVVEKRLREAIEPSEPVRILLRTTDARLRQLPWHLWEFVEHYPQAEVALSLPPARSLEHTSSNGQVKILAILGDRRGIDTDTDRQLLTALPEAEVLFLVEPSRQELHHHLWEQPWDILFFAGHSQTEASQGRLHLNPEDSLTIAELKYGLRQAISHGLQLAIFNSCDGLGLAYELEQLHLPQLIVMREPVPDQVAQAFLKHFLAAFAGGKSLYQAVREGRERLQGLEGQYPCASWLPIICQNPAVLPPTWQSLRGDFRKEPDLGVIDRDTRPVQPARINTAQPVTAWLMPLLTSLAVMAVMVGIRYVGWLQPLEIAAFDHLLQLRSDELIDPRLLVVLVTDEDVQAQDQANRRGSLSDQTLDHLLRTLAAHQPRAIGLDIYRDYLVSETEPKLAQYFRQNDRVISVCKVGDAEKSGSGVAPPPEAPSSQVAFSDVVFDSDNIVRRHLLAMTPGPTSRCTASYALSVQLALRYLSVEGVTLQYLNQNTWQLGKLRFQPLQNHQGGYQTVDDRGHQILLNYRALGTSDRGVRQVTLGQILAGQINPEAIRDRIVLIGTIAEGTHDYWLTPYFTQQGNRLAIPGVLLQAQMTSQLLSAALDGRPLLWSWPLWVEVVWLGGWACLGGWLTATVRNSIYLGLVGGGTIAGLVGLCVGVLFQLGGWLPLVPAIGVFVISGMGVRTLESKRR